MISLTELNPHGYSTTPEIDANLQTLLYRINRVRAEYGIAMTVNSGLRSEADQQRINPSAPKSKHLTGQAVDIADPDGKLKEWVKDHLPFMAQIGLWMEAFESTPTWLHAQIVAPKSGNRIFIP